MTGSSGERNRPGTTGAPPAVLGPRASRRMEDELDSLITAIKKERESGIEPGGANHHGPIHDLHEKMLKEFIPIFVELVEKYSDTGFKLLMDASNFLEGGREIRFEFAIGEYRTELLGTVTTEAIAFHETRFNPEVRGELISGPMLRLRHLTGKVFRDFVCERLLVLGRSSMRRR